MVPQKRIFKGNEIVLTYNKHERKEYLEMVEKWKKSEPFGSRVLASSTAVKTTF